MRRLLNVSLEQDIPKIDPYLCDVISINGDVALEGFVGDIKNWFRGKIDLQFKDHATYDRNGEKFLQIRERLKHKGKIKEGKEKLVTKMYIEDLIYIDKPVIDFDSLKKLFAEQKDFYIKLLNDVSISAKELVEKYKEAIQVSEKDLDKAYQILLDYCGLYLSKNYRSLAVTKVSNHVSLSKTYFGHINLKFFTSDKELYFTVVDSQDRFNPPNNVTALSKEECLEAIDIIEDYHKTVFDTYIKIWDGNLKDYHKSLNEFRDMHSGWQKLPPDERDKLGKIADIVYEITSDFRPLAGIASSVLNAVRASQYYVVYSMESLENL